MYSRSLELIHLHNWNFIEKQLPISTQPLETAILCSTSEFEYFILDFFCFVLFIFLIGEDKVKTKIGFVLQRLFLKIGDSFPFHIIMHEHLSWLSWWFEFKVMFLTCVFLKSSVFTGFTKEHWVLFVFLFLYERNWHFSFRTNLWQIQFVCDLDLG